MKKLAFIAATLAIISSPAAAETKKKAPYSTTYKNYTIAGDTAGEVLVSMIRRGPTVGGVKAYATTVADFSQSGEMIGNSEFCKVRNYQFVGNFVITTPRLKNEKALQGSSLRAWQTFSAFLKRYEETHRAIWLQCGAAHTAKVRKLTGPNCRAVEAKAKKLWEQTRRSCRKKHDAFDAAEQRALMSQPLVRLALAANVVQQKRRNPLLRRQRN